MSPIKIIILILLAVIIISLASGLKHLLHRDGSGEKLARALTIRISLSLLLLVLIIISYALGWLAPHSLLPVPVVGGN
ncbi:MAG: twin transmembrane helix small protein [Candidatus Competibacteraceae bacterium]|nr:twin transmembrane helix small protein [Candidatus Competibacteraceae bacterium]MCB1804417.1 twin transmembrane helix small protein [Candidatus Competibacteraceae bacterium]MCB1812584.1 twin transmembrane helix small protein [Candidatus Competibacteraceae bacterium]